MNSPWLIDLKADGSVVTRENADTGFFAYILYQIAVTAGVLIVVF